jgi:hypothetical protein
VVFQERCLTRHFAFDLKRHRTAETEFEIAYLIIPDFTEIVPWITCHKPIKPCYILTDAGIAFQPVRASPVGAWMEIPKEEQPEI